MIHTSHQLKVLVRNISKGDSAKAQSIIRNYVLTSTQAHNINNATIIEAFINTSEKRGSDGGRIVMIIKIDGRILTQAKLDNWKMKHIPKVLLRIETRHQ